MEIILSSLLGYALGSIPFGLLLTRFVGLGDIRKVGSGNIGATNVLRTGRKDIALATLLLDGGKAAFAVILAKSIGLLPEVAGAAALVGHCFPVWLKFKGGKGVATFIGALLVLWFPAGLLTCLTWLGTAAISRISSLSALIASAAAPLVLFSMGKPSYSIAAIVMTLIIFIRHRENIQRILNGKEPKIGKGKSQSETASPSQS